jgi:hypothetical protein
MPKRAVTLVRNTQQSAADVFAGGSQATAAVDFAPLHAKIGQLALENDSLPLF